MSLAKAKPTIKSYPFLFPQDLALEILPSLSRIIIFPFLLKILAETYKVAVIYLAVKTKTKRHHLMTDFFLHLLHVLAFPLQQSFFLKRLYSLSSTSLHLFSFEPTPLILLPHHNTSAAFINNINDWCIAKSSGGFFVLTVLKHQ